MIYYLISIIPITLFLVNKTNKALQMLQQNRYNDNNWYIKWIINNIKKVFLSYDLLFLVVFVISFFVEFKISEIIAVIVGTILLYYQVTHKEQSKKPLVFTKRVKRLLITYYLLYSILIFTTCYYFNYDKLGNYYLFVYIFVYLAYILVYLANIINKPIEKMYAKHFKNQAIKKLNGMKHMEVIGITGSYGKTSSKNILNDILNIKYNSFPTPKNFNTELGLINTINNYLDKFSDYFIAEMGALKQGDIKTYCDLVHPKYGILTVIGTAHLETFGSQENIQKGKFALIESLPSDGIGILNGDDEWQLNYQIKNDCKIVMIGIDNHDVDIYAKKIDCSNQGMTFDVYFKKLKKSFPFKTTLLGKANIYNILAAIALGYELGISIEELQRAVLKVKPVEHRLQLIKRGDMTLIDDAYNSNPTGSKMALEVLDMMKGTKIIITPGMVELGERQYELNKQLGVYISEVCDEVILVGEKQTKPIYDGLKEKKYSLDKIHIVENINQAFELLNKLKGKEKYVLIENDLPDIF